MIIPVLIPVFRITGGRPCSPSKQLVDFAVTVTWVCFTIAVAGVDCGIELSKKKVSKYLMKKNNP